jgi:glycosyltransferase involved in cell wall biosynthesis
MTEMPTAATRPAALIFQKRLLRWSETFIAAQGGALARYRPVFIGLQRSSGGASYLDGFDQLLLAEHTPVLALGKLALRSLGHIAPRWLRAMEGHHATILHAHFLTSAPLALPIARALGIPLVVTCHGIDITVEPRSARQRAARDRVFAEADRIIAVSEFIAERLRAAGCPADKIVLHHIGIDTDHFAPAAGLASAAGVISDTAGAPVVVDAPRTVPKTAPTTPRILFVGRLVAKKGLIHLLRIMPELQRAVEGVELLIAGDGPLRAQLEAEAARLGARSRFLGIQTPDQVRDLMRQAILLCAPSIVAANGDAEGLPMTILEAQASALPVVAFPSGGSAEGVRHGETGLIAPRGDETKLADYLLALLTDPDRQRRYSAAARAHVLERFDLRRQTGLLEDIYDEVREARTIRS